MELLGLGFKSRLGRHFFLCLGCLIGCGIFLCVFCMFNRKLKKAFLHCRLDSADGLLRWSDGWFGAACFCLGKIANETLYPFCFIDTGFRVSHAGYGYMGSLEV
jgi:hypothetical protein